MAAFFAWVTELLERYRAWEKARAIKWEDRYITHYQQQIADCLRGIEEAKKRREKAEARRH